MEYRVDDREVRVEDFLNLADNVWPGKYDVEKTQEALKKTMNFTVYQDGNLIGCLRILTDGYYFGTITELLVLPRSILQHCCTLAPSRRQKHFMRRMAVKEGCSLM